MKMKYVYIIGGVVLLSLLGVGVAYAFEVGNVDGVWSAIDSGQDAYCSRWASGGLSTSRWRNTLWDQTTWSGGPFNTDENLVLYGREARPTDSWPYWETVSCADTDLDEQSGFGFDGYDGPIEPEAKTPFYLGAFKHYNQPIFSTRYTGDPEPASNPFEYVDLTVTVPVTCNDEETDVEFSFDVRMTLDETPNGDDPCKYGPDRPPDYSGPDFSTHCWDKVILTQDDSSNFTCPDGVYTVNILGFTSEGLEGAPCNQSFNPASVSTEYITKEGDDNAACLWAEIDQPEADLDANKTCQAIDTQDPFYRIVIVNEGPGSSREVVLEDTLPAGANYDSERGWSSKLTTSLGTYDQGECEVDGKDISCRLLTTLPDWVTDPAAKWTVDIPVTWTGDSKINTVTVSAATYDPDEDNNTDTAECNPTSAFIIYFDAENTPQGVLLSWETANEVDNLGFNIYRADDPEGEKARVNPGLIPSKAMGSTSGAVYEFLDEDGAVGGKYYYWLEDVDFAMSTTLYGPISPK